MASYLRSLIGVGRLHVSDQDAGEVTYSITVSRKSNTIRGDGVLSGNERGVLSALGREAHLILEGGERLKIFVHDANLRRGLFGVDPPALNFAELIPSA